MMNSYFNVTVIAEWITFVAALVLLNRKTGVWQLFIPVLFITLCVETTGWYMTYLLKKTNNSLPFNLLMLINAVFMPWLLSGAEVMIKVRRLVLLALVVFLLCAIINLLFIQGVWIYNFYTQTAGDMLLLIVCCLFFYSILREEIYRNLFRYEYFWLAAGFLFTSFGSMVLYLFLELLFAYYKKTGINVYGYINYGINLLLYTSLIIAFICRRRIMK